MKKKADKIFFRHREPPKGAWRSRYVKDGIATSPSGLLAMTGGFTLMELLLAMTLFAIASVSSYGVFSMGIQIWKRAQGSGQYERKAILAIEKMGHDIRMVIRTKPDEKLGEKSFEFRGDSAEVVLPAFINYKARGKDLARFGSISYKWNKAKKELCRQEMTASDLYQQKTVACKPVAGALADFKFQYWIYNEIGKSYSWYDSWTLRDGIPAAIRIRMTLQPPKKNGKISPATPYQRTFVVPVLLTPEMMKLEETVSSPDAEQAQAASQVQNAT